MARRVGGASEYDISLGTLEYLNSRPGGEASIDELVDHLPDHVVLSDNDLSISTTRPNERLWEQRVRNIVSHKDSPNNFINLGYLESNAGSLRITDAGRDYLKRQRS